MREQNRPEEVAVANERSLSTLSRAITFSEGQFALILVRCNYDVCKEQMWRRLQELTNVSLIKLALQESTKTLYTTILSALAGEQAAALLVFGLESVAAIDQMLISTNQVREEFRLNLTLPLVLWVTDEVLQKLTRFAPDFKSWAATSIKFELNTDHLLSLWDRTTDKLFSTILESDLAEFLPNNVLNLAPGCRQRQELEAALRDLHARGVGLKPVQRATWQFILGRDAFSYDQIDVAIELSQQSLGFWRQQVRWGDKAMATTSLPHPETSSRLVSNSSSLECIGVLLHQIGLCYRRQAELQPLESRSKWEQARASFSAAIEVLAAAERSDLVAQLTIQLGEVLQYLQSWTDLQALALQALEQSQTQNSPVQLAKAYGFLAAVAHAQSDWQTAKDLAIAALDILDRSQSPHPYHQVLHLLLLAKAQRHLGEPLAAIAELEQAIRVETWLSYRRPTGVSLQQQPQLYIEILEELRSLYLEQKQYLRAFELKQEQRCIEQQYGFCTFLGAAPLQPRRQSRGIWNSPLEIAAAGRLPDVNRLIERLSRNDHKLTIVHGSSGVGKSSLINAGLVPALETRIIGARATLPVVQKVYGDWVGELERRLTEALVSWKVGRWDSSNEQPLPSNVSLPSENGDAFGATCQPSKLQTILEQLRLSFERNLLTILIFDQFEEFFFACTDLVERRQFYYFLVQCLNFPSVKVILSLREDYLHYLLECERYGNLSAINNNILDRQLRYHLGDLSPEEAKNVICTLTAMSQFQLEESLIEALVQDLAGSTGAVRLIELQVVGAQLQAEKITTLEQYYSLGADPKTSLVERSLLNVIDDCGQENADMVWEVLFSLTDDKGTRPLKTKPELVRKEFKIDRLNEELNVGTLKVMGWLGNHLAPNLRFPSLSFNNPDRERRSLNLPRRLNVRALRFTNASRRTGTPTLQEGLRATHLPRKKRTGNGLSNGVQPSTQEDKLDLILKILVGSGLVFRVPEELQERYQLVHDYLVEPIRRKYEQRTQLNIFTRLERSQTELLRVRRQRLRAIAVGVTMALLAVSACGFGWRAEVQRRLAAALSLNAQLRAISASSEALFVSNKKFDALIEGLRAARRLKEVESREEVRIGNGLFPMSYSSSLPVEPDTRLQVVTALSQAVYGTSERNRLEGHGDVVWNISFSPDGQLIASASADKTVKLWRPDGTLVTTLFGHQNSVTSVAFSPDSQLIASSSWDGTVRLWRRDGTVLRTLKGHIGHIYSVSFSPNGQLVASTGGDGTVRLWTIAGKLIGTFRGHEGVVQWVSFSPNGEIIASASKDKTIKLWTAQGKLLQTLKGHSAKVNCVVFSPDGETIASASDDRTIKLWSRTGKLLKTFPKHPSWVFGVAFSADSQRLASASGDNTVRLWNPNGTLVKTFTGHSDSITAVSFSPSGVNQLIASASFDKTIKLWSRRDQPRLVLQHQTNVKDVTFSPDNKLIAAAGTETTVKIWDRNGQLLNTLRGHSDRICSISFSPDGQLIASASRDGTVKLWTRSGTLIETLKGHKDWVLSVSFSPDGRQLASASRDGTVKLWTRKGILIKTLVGHRERVNVVRFSPDGQLLVSASDDKTVKLWTADGTLRKTLLGHTNWVLDVSFSADSQMLASASYDNTVKLWNRKGDLFRTLRGHTDSVAHVRFSPTGKILATSSWDNRIQLWRLDDTLIKTLENHKERITSVNWSSDGKALVSASQGNEVIVWNLDLNELLDKSCNWLRDYLKNNPKVRQSDRSLCKPIETLKSLENSKKFYFKPPEYPALHP
jgi:WD40 repeat protein/tetratricopeptide (TPR) repeat protein